MRQDPRTIPHAINSLFQTHRHTHFPWPANLNWAMIITIHFKNITAKIYLNGSQDNTFS